MKISACIIMKDAAKDLEDCLESLKDGVDEIVVTDTGSEDASVEIARRYTDKVYSFPWRDDFAAAKNFCLDRATGDWIVFPDSDEYFTRETRGNLRRISEDMYAKGYTRAYVQRVNVDENHVPKGGSSEDLSVRMFRGGSLLRYRNPIHEQLVYTGSGQDKAGAVPVKDLCLYHKGYSPTRMKEKFRRNMQLLEKLENSGEERPGLTDFYLGGMYFTGKEYEKAIYYMKRAVERNELPDFGGYAAWRLWYRALKALRRSAGEQEEVLLGGMKAFPKMPDFYAHYAMLLLERKDYEKALGYFKQAEKLMGEAEVNCPWENNAMYSYRDELYHVMSDTCLSLGRREEALHYAEMEWEARKPSEERGGSEWIPPRSQRVTEFGFGAGEAGAAFRRIRPDCRYIGVDEERAKPGTPAEAYTETLEGTPATADLGRMDGAADCILYRDRALWGLTADILRRHAEHLAPEGQMIFLPENLSYFPTLIRAFAGHLAPRSQSTLTPGRLKEMLGNAGMKILSMEPIRFPGDAAERENPETKALYDAFADRCRAEGITEVADAWAGRFLVRAAKKLPERKLLIQVILGDAVLSGRVRVTEPYGFLRTVPGVSCTWDSRGADLTPREEFPRRMLVRQRQIFGDAWEQQLDIMRKSGSLLVYETDVLPPGWEKEEERGRNLDILGAHVIQVPTEALAEALRPYHPHVAVFPNELGELPPARDYGGDGPLTIFFGAFRREGDWQDILPVLNEVAGERGDGIRFTVLSDKEFYRALKTGNKKFVGNDAYYGGRVVPYEIYGQELHRADIALLPLGDTETNRVKSDLKFLESAGHGAAVLASPTVYGATVRDGETGYIYRSPEEFREKLLRLLDDGECRRGMARAAYDYVGRERMLSRHYEERLAFYNEMLDRREELDRELEQRMAKRGAAE